MTLIVNREVQEDRWRHLADDEPIVAGSITVTLSRWLELREAHPDSPGSVGVRLEPADDVERLLPWLDRLQLITVEFSSFTEGRGYSQARLLRQRGFTGEIRARGARLDHVAFMQRCGINAVELDAQEDPAAVLASFDGVRVRYQPAQDDAVLVFHTREDQLETTGPAS